MRQESTETVDKSVCTEDGGAARLEAVLLALVERKARAIHAEHARTHSHPLLLLLRHHESETSILGSPGELLPRQWCEHELKKGRNKTLKLREDLESSEQFELERRRRRRRRRRSPRASTQKPQKHRTLLVSAIDEQAKVIHVLDPDELPRRARYTIMVTACLLLFLCLLLVGVTLRMAPLIDDMASDFARTIKELIISSSSLHGLPIGSRNRNSGPRVPSGRLSLPPSAVGICEAIPNEWPVLLSSPGERAYDARRHPGGSTKSHPVFGSIPLTPRYPPRMGNDNIRPPAGPPEDPGGYSLYPPVSETPAGLT